MAAITAFCLIGDTMLYIALPLCWQQCGLDALWQVGVLLAVNRLVRLPLNPLVRRLYTRFSRRTGMLLAVLLAAGTTLLYGVAQSSTRLPLRGRSPTCRATMRLRLEA